MGSCKFVVDHWVQKKGEAIRMKVVGATETYEKAGDKLTGCIYQCQLPNGTHLTFSEEELDHWDDTPTTEVFVDNNINS
jgi:hypothetical protein